MICKEELERIYRTHFQTVWNLCYTCLRHPADTEDAVQATFEKLARSGKRFRDGEHEKAWLIVTARNVCRDELRRRGRNAPPLEQTTPAVPAHRMDETLLALNTLPQAYRLVLYLFYYEELSTRQIAALLKKPDATVRSHLHRGRKLLKEQLEGEA